MFPRNSVVGSVENFMISTVNGHGSLYHIRNFVFSFMDDCQERHTIFRNKDMLGLCPSTGFIKVSL